MDAKTGGGEAAGVVFVCAEALHIPESRAKASIRVNLFIG